MFVVLYLFTTLLIGLGISQKVKTSIDFINTGRRLPLVLNAAALFALWFGSETVLGASGTYAEEGLLGVIEDPFGAALCLFIAALFFVRPLFRMNLLTLGDFYEQKFGKSFGLLASCCMVISFFSYVAGQFVALGIIFSEVFHWPIFSGIVICAVIVCIYTMAGGLWAVSVTDLIQGIVICIGLTAALFYTSQKLDTWQNFQDGLQLKYLSFLPSSDLKSIIQWVGAWIMIGLGSVPSQDIFQRFNAARNEKTAIRSTWLGGLIYLIMSIIPLLLTLIAIKLGFTAGHNYEGWSEGLLPALLEKHSPLWVQTLFFGALLSAILSTASGALLAPAGILAENVIIPFSKVPQHVLEKSNLKILRLSVLGIALCSLMLALIFKNIFELVALSSAISLVTLFVPLCGGLFSKKPKTLPAFVSLIFGLSVYFFLIFIPFDYLPAHLGGLLASIFGYLVSGPLLKCRL